MNAREMIGSFLISIPYICLFLLITYIDGVLIAAGVFIATAILIGLPAAGVILILENSRKKRKEK